ncbi:MAG: serine/threonine-protein kinase, partial [Acidimicrobiia bacterium]
IDMAGLFPFFLQVACSAFFEHLAESGHVDLAAVRASFLEEAEPHFNYICEHLDEDQRGVLDDLIEARAVPPERQYVLGKLKRDGYILEQDGQTRLFSSALIDWVRQGRIRHRSTGGQRTSGTLTLRSGLPEYPPKPGDHLSHFRILQPLARGGMSLLFTAEDLRLGRRVVLKVLPPEVVTDAERKRRFLQEARAASALSHPNIAVVHEVDEVDGISFIAMERVEGETIRRRLADGPLKLDQIVSIGGQVADALAAAHARGIVHRDVKPENVMIQPDGGVKVLDFGIAKLAELNADRRVEANPSFSRLETTVGVRMGTVAYMSPEQARGDAVDHRSDIFSLGAMLFEMATGGPPFQRETSIDTLHAILHVEPSTEKVAPVYGPGLRTVVARALEKEPARRYQSMADLAAELRRGTDVAPEPPRTLGERVKGWLKGAKR